MKPTETLPKETVVAAVSKLLFDDPALTSYAILDGASVEGLLDKLYDVEPEFKCLYRGQLAPDMAVSAPYLIELEPDSELVPWILSEGWGRHWGIFAVTSADLRTLRQHFRKLLMVKDPDRKRLYFRYYDPRVLRVFLPTCTPEERQTFFGPIQTYIVEDRDPSNALQFTSAKPRPQKIPLGEASSNP